MRLIDADVLTDAIENSRGKNSIYAQFVRAWIKDAPTIDAVPVRYGHWIKISPAGIYECSECGKNVMTNDIEAYEYCHGCGAIMDGENNE